MNARITRRWFGGALGLGLIALASPRLVSEPGPVDDPRVAALIARSRDRHGQAHVARAAFVDGVAVSGTLALSRDELASLRAALDGTGATRVHAGRARFYVTAAEPGVLHAARRGERLTARASGGALVIATSVDGMTHGRAVQAVRETVGSDDGRSVC